MSAMTSAPEFVHRSRRGAELVLLVLALSVGVGAYAAVGLGVRGELPADTAREQLARIQRLPIRLLVDAVLRRRAWELAEQLGWASTYDAEYVALTQLQADALVTLDSKLARRVEGIVTTASIDALRQ